MTKECVFCKIISGELPSMKVYEDELTMAFMDLAKDVDGHILVIPKKHYKSVLDCVDNTLNHTMSTVKKVANYLVDNCGYDGVDLMNANDESAGQTIPHLHIHIIPRRYNDGLGESGEWPKFPGAKYAIEDMYKRVRMI